MLALDIDEPEVTRDVAEGTLVDDPDELTDVVLRPEVAGGFIEILLARATAGAAGCCPISPARSARVFLFGLSDTIGPGVLARISNLFSGPHLPTVRFAIGKLGGPIMRAFPSASVISCRLLPGVAGILDDLILGIFAILGGAGSRF